MQYDVLEKKNKVCHYFCCAVEHVVAEHLSLSLAASCRSVDPAPQHSAAVAA